MHVLHENLTISEYNGRQIVGWVGTDMLIMSLTGLRLWWPRGGRFLRGYARREQALASFS